MLLNNSSYKQKKHNIKVKKNYFKNSTGKSRSVKLLFSIQQLNIHHFKMREQQPAARTAPSNKKTRYQASIRLYFIRLGPEFSPNRALRSASYSA